MKNNNLEEINTVNNRDNNHIAYIFSFAKKIFKFNYCFIKIKFFWLLIFSM